MFIWLVVAAMTRLTKSMMISTTKSSIPFYLQQSAFYLSLGDFDDAPIDIPTDCMKENDEVASSSEALSLLKTLRFWGEDCLPESLIDYTLKNMTENWGGYIFRIRRSVAAGGHVNNTCEMFGVGANSDGDTAR